MKKKFFGSLAVLAIAAVAAFNVNINASEEGLSDISLANAEALASESGQYCCRQSEINKDELCNIYTDGIYCPCGW